MNPRNIYHLLPKYYKSRFLFIIMLFILGSLLETISISLIIPLIQALADPQNTLNFLTNFQDYIFYNISSEKELILLIVLSMLLIYLSKTLLSIFVSVIQAHYVHGLEIEISNRLFNKYLHTDFSYHNLTPSSKMIQTVITESSQFARGAVRTLLTIIAECVMLSAILAFLLYFSPLEVLVAIVIISLVGGVYFFFLKDYLRQLGQQRQLTEALRIQAVQFGLDGFREITISNTQSYFLKLVTNLNKNLKSIYVWVAVLGNLPKLVFEFLGVSLILSIILFSIILETEIQMVATKLAVFGAALFRTIPSISKIIIGLQNLRYAAIVVKRIQTELKQGPRNEFNNETKGSCSLGRFRQIQFSDVNFSYDDNQFISQLNFNISEGQTVAFVGPSGSGKSSIINLFLGFLEPKKGKITVNNRQLRTVLKNWRHKVGYISQNVFLVDATILENIAFGINPADIDIRKAEKSFINAGLGSAPGGLSLNTPVGERGMLLSGGQKQRVALARALYSNPEILVLDEFTSALDSETEVQLTKTVTQIPDITVVLVTHSRRVMDFCDRVLEVRNGTLSERVLKT